MRRIPMVVAVVFLCWISSSANAQTFNLTSGTGSWNTAGNWTPSGVPNAIGASATFNSPTDAQIVQLNAGITVGSITATNNNATTILTISNGTGGSLTFDVTSGNATFTTSGTSATTNNVSLSASVTLNDTLELNINNVAATGSAAATFTGTVVGSGGIIKNGEGSFSFSTSAKAYTGATVVNAGILRYTASGASTGTSGITVNSGGQLRLDSNTGAFSFGSATIDLNGAGSTGALASQGALRNQNSGATTLANVVNMASDATIHTNNAGNSLQLNGNLTGTGLLTKTGGGTLIINGTANTHTGGYSVTNGVVTVNSGRTIGGPITMAQAAGNNTVFTINSNQTVSALASAWVDTTGTRTQTVNLNGAGTILTVDQTTNTTFGNGAVDTLASVIAGVGGLTKSNTGTLTLASANTYSGGTTISGGTVLATNSTGSATGTAGITVSGTGVLSGGTGAGTTIGSVTGATNVQTGGTIRADSGTGTNTLTVGNVTIQNGGTLAANIAATNNNSTLAVGGNVLDFATGSRLGLVGQSGFASVEGGPTLTYNLATLSSGSNIRLDGNVAGVADGFVFGEYVHGTGNVNSRPVFIDTTNFGLALNNGDRLVLNRTGNNLVLQFSPVPEPTTILGVAVGLVAVGGFIRKRLAKKAVVAA